MLQLLGDLSHIHALAGGFLYLGSVAKYKSKFNMVQYHLYRMYDTGSYELLV